ncbi:MAG: hypothetical protein GVY27_08625 [Deinococcus-Thermus bacterium]|jgi:DNA-binding winged helix-turn-helix (wHTH) protein|nr:hypothetical protein [Deinococcota bacterium]
MRYRFGPFELDLDAHRLRRDGADVPLEPQVFDLLVLLVRRAGDLVHRDAIVATVWGGRAVSEATISSRIAVLRRALGDDGRRQAIVQTVPRRGLRFVAPVEAVDTTETGGRVAPAGPAGRSGPDAAAQTVRMARSFDGTRIAWATTGAGPPLLRAGHFLTHLEHDWQSPIWRPLLDRLGRSFALTRYDQRRRR